MSFINPISDKRRKTAKDYARIRKAYLAANPNCAAHRTLWGKSAIADQIHHTRGRAGTLYTDARFFLSVCARCHRWIGENPARARELRFLAPAGQWNSPG